MGRETFGECVEVLVAGEAVAVAVAERWGGGMAAPDVLCHLFATQLWSIQVIVVGGLLAPGWGPFVAYRDNKTATTDSKKEDEVQRRQHLLDQDPKNDIVLLSSRE